MTRSILAAAVIAVSLALLSGGAALPAGAQPNTCPAPGPDAVRVALTEPPAGAAVAGRVTVRGSVSSPVEVARVELFVGDARRDFAVFEPAAREGTFLLTWDSAGQATGPATLRVVACGGGQGPVPLVRGVASVAVVVQPGPAPAAPIPLRPVVADGDRSDRGPLWVGAVFAAAGLGGLLVAGGYRVRRVPRPPRRRPPAAPSPAQQPEAQPEA